MAICTPMRPRWNPRSGPILYVNGGQLCARSRPGRVYNPRTHRQMRQRTKFKALCALMQGLTPAVRLGFPAGQNPSSGRRIGAYHVALGHNLARGAAADHLDTVQLDFAQVQMAMGQPALLGEMRWALRGQTLQLRWKHPTPSGARLLLVGYYAHATSTAGCQLVRLDEGPTTHATLELPEGMERGPIELWVAPWVGDHNRGRWDSAHLHIDPAVGGTAPWELHPTYTEVRCTMEMQLPRRAWAKLPILPRGRNG